MVRGRTKKTTSDSFELLLDTVTNTFGGILFLAILVALILQRTSPSPQSSETTSKELEPFSEVDFAETEVRITALTDRIAALRLELKNVPRRKNTQQDGEITKLAGELRALDEEVAQAVVDKAHAEVSVAQLQKETAKINNEAMSLKERKKNVELTNKLVSDQLAAEEETANQLAMAVSEAREHLEPKPLEQTVTLPVLKKTSKRPFTFYVRYGKLFIPFNEPEFTLNTNHFVAVGRPPVAFCRPERGIPLHQSDVGRIVSRELSGFSTSANYIQILVFEDSFEHFQAIKNTLVRLSYKYAVFPHTAGDQIRFGSGQGSAQ